MAVDRAPGGTSLIDVLDRILDKGIVIDAWVRISLVGIDLITVEARVVIASIDTYLKYAEAVGITGTVSRPAVSRGEGHSSMSASTPVQARKNTPTPPEMARRRDPRRGRPRGAGKSPPPVPAPCPPNIPILGSPISQAVNRRVTRSRSWCRKPPIPSAAATAKVSRPSGTIRPTSFSSTSLI